MPEAFSSIAETEKLEAGLAAANNLVARFAAEGATSPQGFDAIVGVVGATAVGVRGKFQFLATGVETAVGLYRQFSEEGRAVAQSLGVTKEYDALIKTVDDLGLTIRDGAVGAFFALGGAATDTASSVLGFTSSVHESDAAAKGFAATLLNSVTASLQSARLQLRLWKSEVASNAGEINTTVDLARARLREIDVDLARMESGELAKTRTGHGRIGGVTVDVEKGLLQERAKLPGQDWIDATVVSKSLLQDEIASLERRSATLGMSAGKAAEYNAVQQAIASAERQNLPVHESQLELIRQEAAEIGRLTDEYERRNEAEAEVKRKQGEGERQDRAVQGVLSGIGRDIETERQRAATIGLSASEATKLLTVERALAAIRQAGREPRSDEVEQIHRLAAMRAVLAERTQELQGRFEEFGEITKLVTTNVERAFQSLTSGAKISFDDMARAILADLAMIEFRASVIKPLQVLFGGPGSGSGSDGSGGLIASIGSAIFGGYRADGGDVEPGRGYIVGERGPEPFFPRLPGTILPNSALGAAAAGAAQAQPASVRVYLHPTKEFDARIQSTAESVVVTRAPAIAAGAVEAVHDTLPGMLREAQSRSL